jgi:cullin 3
MKCLLSQLTHQVERRLSEEQDRATHYLSSATAMPLQELVVANMLTTHLQTILHMPGTGLVSMLDSDRTDDLRRLYKLFLRVPDSVGKDGLRIALRESVEARGKGINDAVAGISADAGPGMDGEDLKGKAPARAPSAQATALTQALRWVQDVLDLKDKFDHLWENAFSSDKQVQASINEVSFVLGAVLTPRPCSRLSTPTTARPSSSRCSLTNT